MVGGLVCPSAEAVTIATPSAAGVQTLKKGAFQLPAQAKPVGEMSSIPGLLEVKVKVGEMFPFAAF
jgi:hypothetical protein